MFLNNCKLKPDPNRIKIIFFPHRKEAMLIE